MLTLAGNRIISVAAEAFSNLKALQHTPDDFNPKNEDGTSYKNVYGFGVCHPGCVCGALN